MDTSRIFVKGLPPKITEADFRKHFSQGGREVTDVKLILQRRIGYVGYKTPQDASKAVKYFNRSYIRMSRVAVEFARPISDSPQQSTGREVHQSTLPARVRKETVLDIVEDNSAKKRKRDDLDESDPKLREYLQVMQRGNKTANDMSEMIDNPDADTFTEAHKKMVQDGESDDEYEAVPSRAEKRQMREPPQVARADHLDDDKPMPPAEDLEVTQKQADAPPPNTATTDDDWLFARKNRLLDLVDDDEEPRPATTQSRSQAPPPQRDEPSAIVQPQAVRAEEAEVRDADHSAGEAAEEGPLGMVQQTSRLFVRNLAYTVTEGDLRTYFGKFGELQEVHLPVSGASNKGYALVLYTTSRAAMAAFQASDGQTLQGRLLHVLPAAAKRDHGLDEFAISKLPLKKQNMIRKKAEAASRGSFEWNALYMNQDAINASVANRLGVSKADLLDPTDADGAVKQAIAETSVIQETKSYFASNGVDLDAFKSHERGGSSILVKNFPFGTTIDELRTMFEEYGTVLRVLMPPSGTIAIVHFAQDDQAKAAFGRLAYRRIKESVLFLEKGPKGLFRNDANMQMTQVTGDQPSGVQKLSVTELLGRDEQGDGAMESSSLFVRNLSFATTTAQLAEAFTPLDGFVSARVKTKPDNPKKPGQILSMGFGFVQFRTKEQASLALKAMDGFVLGGHALGVKASHRGQDAAEERRKEDQAKKSAGQKTKIMIRNLPFEVTKKDVRSLFGTYGQLKAVRIPKKFGNTSRGYGFAEYVTPREAENALNALRDTHLLGRRLVLEFAEAEAVDAEEEIAKMQRKIGGQVNKVALQQLTGKGRTKVNIGGDNEAGLDS